MRPTYWTPCRCRSRWKRKWATVRGRRARARVRRPRRLMERDVPIGWLPWSSCRNVARRRQRRKWSRSSLGRGTRIRSRCSLRIRIVRNGRWRRLWKLALMSRCLRIVALWNGRLLRWNGRRKLRRWLRNSCLRYVSWRRMKRWILVVPRSGSPWDRSLLYIVTRGKSSRRVTRLVRMRMLRRRPAWKGTLAWRKRCRS